MGRLRSGSPASGGMQFNKLGNSGFCNQLVVLI